MRPLANGAWGLGQYGSVNPVRPSLYFVLSLSEEGQRGLRAGLRQAQPERVVGSFALRCRRAARTARRASFDTSGPVGPQPERMVGPCAMLALLPSALPQQPPQAP